MAPMSHPPAKPPCPPPAEALLRRRAEALLRRQRGAAAETLAVHFLEARGLTVLERNARCRCGEVDLVCAEGEVIALVEVRQRGRTAFGGAAASVTWRKQRKLIRAARYLSLTRAAWRGRALRFDVVSVQGRPPGACEIEWIRGAFCAT